ncbi:MAG: glycosyltransferase family 9 protein [Pseudobdellovibrionaceae bacterium]
MKIGYPLPPMNSSVKKAVFIRLDKIGDLICTLPIDQAPELKDWEITWVISQGLSFIPEHAVPKRRYIELDKKNPSEARQKFAQLLQELKPQVAISIQAPWWVNFLLWKNKVPQRIGVLSKWDSFLFLNAGLRQKRSQAVKHEADYNFDLVRRIFTSQTLAAKAPVLKLKAVPQPATLETYQLEAEKYFVVHPGMAGSALNWSIPHYLTLVEALASRGKVVLTGTPADEPWLKEIKAKFRNHSQVLCLQNKLDAQQLLYILEQAAAVFAPSTGVIHLAASLGTPVYGFYSPVLVQSEKRWGPRGPGPIHLFTPPKEAPTMESISPEQVLKELR